MPSLNDLRLNEQIAEEILTDPDFYPACPEFFFLKAESMRVMQAKARAAFQKENPGRQIPPSMQEKNTGCASCQQRQIPTSFAGLLAQLRSHVYNMRRELPANCLDNFRSYLRAKYPGKDDIVMFVPRAGGSDRIVIDNQPSLQAV